MVEDRMVDIAQFLLDEMVENAFLIHGLYPTG